MKLYVLSLGTGLLVGVIYHLLGVRSPAPPLVALAGLLGIVLGEQAIPVSKQLLRESTFSIACGETRAADHVLGQLPGRHAAGKPDSDERAQP